MSKAEKDVRTINVMIQLWYEKANKAKVKYAQEMEEYKKMKESKEQKAAKEPKQSKKKEKVKGVDDTISHSGDEEDSEEEAAEDKPANGDAANVKIIKHKSYFRVTKESNENRGRKQIALY